MPMPHTPIDAPAAASPEVSARPRRRHFTVADKLRILAETDKAAETGGVGAILRRERVYSSSLTDWRRQRDAGAFQALSPARRGPKVAPVNPFAARLAERERENAVLAHAGWPAPKPLSISKKVSDLLGMDPLPHDGSP